MNKALRVQLSFKIITIMGIGLAAVGCADKLAKKQPSEPRVTVAELLAYCPQVTLTDNTAFYNTYIKGGEGDSAKVIYQAAISDVTRSCSYQDGTLTMKVAAAGRVVPGPQFTPRMVMLPIRVTAKMGDEVVYSKLRRYPVPIKSAETTQFIFSDDQISMPKPQSKNVEIVIGFEKNKNDK